MGMEAYCFGVRRILPLNLDNLRRAFRRVLARAELRCRLYDLRHDFLSRAALKGVPVSVLRALAGHQTLAMVNRYTHLQPGYVDEAVRLVEVRDPGDDLVTTSEREESGEDSQEVESPGAGDWNRTSDLRFTNFR